MLACKPILIAVAILSAGMNAAAQEDVTRVFQFVHVDTPQDVQEVATLVRSIADIRTAAADVTQKSVALRGTAGQIALGEWLIGVLDVDADVVPAAVRHEYRISGGDDVARVFYLRHMSSVQDFQEVATLVRSMGEIRRVFTFNKSRAIALRGTAAQMAMAEWMFAELDRDPDSGAPVDDGGPAYHDYPAPGAPADDVTRVFTLRNAATVQQLQELAVMARAMSESRRVFTYNAPRVIAMRGTPQQMALAAWLFADLAKPPDARAARASGHEFRPAATSDDFVRVFYLAHAATVQRLQEVATHVRTMAEIRRAFTYNSERAIALRGTAAQMALAERLIGEWDQ